MGWIVLGTILLLLSLLLLAPVSAAVAVKDGETAVLVRYLFFRFDLSPGREAKKPTSKKAAKPPKKKKTEPEETEPETQKRSAGELARLGLDLLRGSKKGLTIFRKHLVFSRVQLYISVGGGDAHQTALRYSRVCMAVAAALDVVGLLFALRTPKVGIAPDFTRSSTRYDCSLRVGMRPLFAIAAALSVAARLLPILIRERGSRPRQPKKTAPNNA